MHNIFTISIIIQVSLIASQLQPTTCKFIKDNHAYFLAQYATNDSTFYNNNLHIDDSCNCYIEKLLQSNKKEHIKTNKTNLQYITDKIYIDFLTTLIDYPYLPPKKHDAMDPKFDKFDYIQQDYNLHSVLLFLNLVPYHEIEVRGEIIRKRIANLLAQHNETIAYDSTKKSVLKQQAMQLFALTILSTDDKQLIKSYKNDIPQWALIRAGDSLSRVKLINKFEETKQFDIRSVLSEELNNTGDSLCLLTLIKGVEKQIFQKYDNGLCRSSNQIILTELARRFSDDSLFTSKLRNLLYGVNSLCHPAITEDYFNSYKNWVKEKYKYVIKDDNQKPVILFECSKQGKNRYCE